MPLIYVGYKVLPGCAKYATGVAGTMDALAWQYCLLHFVIGTLQSWCTANNATIHAEARPRPRRARPGACSPFQVMLVCEGNACGLLYSHSKPVLIAPPASAGWCARFATAHRVAGARQPA